MRKTTYAEKAGEKRHWKLQQTTFMYTQHPNAPQCSKEIHPTIIMSLGDICNRLTRLVTLDVIHCHPNVNMTFGIIL